MATINDIPKKNAGFDIIGATMINDHEAIVLGEKKGADYTEYVSWIWTDAGGFFWGHYGISREKAYDEYLARISKEAGCAKAS